MDYILNKENEIYYECGWSSDNALFVKLGDNRYVITDGRYTLSAKDRADAEVIESRDLIKAARELILKHKIKRLVIDPLNWDFESYKRLSLIVKLKNVKNFSFKKREIKTFEELEIIKKAAQLGAVSFKKFAEKIETSIDEYELSFRFKEVLTNRGRRELSFEPIVAINENAAKPHATLTDKTAKKNDLLLLDAGIKYKRYCSDRTRSVNINDEVNMSKKQKFKDAKKQKIYDLVLKAQEKALKSVRVGMKACELDKIARDVIEKEGFGRYFVHSLGHGVGLDIHEFPFINSKNDTVLKEGMVFTIEPGIYLPGEFGVRIEDMVAINYNGEVEILSEEI